MTAPPDTPPLRTPPSARGDRETRQPLGRLIGTSAFRLAVVTVLVFVLLSGALIGFLLVRTNDVLSEQVVATLTAEADALEREAKAGIGDLVAAVSARARPEGPGLYVLIDETGQKRAGNLSRIPPEIADGIGLGRTFRYRPRDPTPMASAERLAIGRTLTLPGVGRLVVGRDVEDQRAYANGVKQLVVVTFTALALLGLAMAFVVTRIVLRRIEAMDQTAREIVAGDLSRRVPRDHEGDELDGLAASLNGMLDRIEHLMAGMREVSDNIAHDLKTPLTRLRNRMEAALRETGPAVHREALERTIEDVDEIMRTFNALLLIARLEAAAVEEAIAPVDLGALVGDVAELYAPVAEEAGLRLEVVAGVGPVVSANRQLVGQAIANLLDNAIKYGGPADGYRHDTRLRVTVTAADGAAEITVADRGPGIPEADRERALRRFVRLDASRSQPGTGLGLSLVAAVARLHGGDVTLADNRPGLAARLRLPLLRDPHAAAVLRDPVDVPRPLPVGVHLTRGAGA